MAEGRTGRVAITIATIPSFLLLWEAISRSGIFNIHLFPPPTAVFQAFIAMLSSGELLADIVASLHRVAVGFTIGALLGISCGVLTGRSDVCAHTLGQLFQLLRPIPAIAFVPLAITWFGLGELSKYFLIIWGVFFPMWLNTHLGVSNVNALLVWAAQSLGASNKKIVYEVVLPHAVPFVIAGARIGIAIAFICLVAAEMSGAFAGIGYRVIVSHLVFRVDKMMVALVMLGILGAGTDLLFSTLTAGIVSRYGGRP